VGQVDSIDLSNVRKRLLKEQTWTPEYTDKVIQEYRRFLLLCLRFPQMTVVPSPAVDEVWHAHILHTRAYANDCQTFLGFFLHHSPSYGAEQIQKDINDFEKMLEKYKELFNGAPDSQVWSRNVRGKAKIGKKLAPKADVSCNGCNGTCGGEGKEKADVSCNGCNGTCGGEGKEKVDVSCNGCNGTCGGEGKEAVDVSCNGCNGTCGGEAKEAVDVSCNGCNGTCGGEGKAVDVSCNGCNGSCTGESKAVDVSCNGCNGTCGGEGKAVDASCNGACIGSIAKSQQQVVSVM